MLPVPVDRLSVILKRHPVAHESQIAVTHGEDGVVNLRQIEFPDQCQLFHGKFRAAEAGRAEVLPLFQTASDDVVMLLFALVVLFAPVARQLKVEFNAVLHIPEKHGGTLGAVFRCNDARIAAFSVHLTFHRLIGNLFLHLVPAYVDKFNRVKYDDPVDYILDCRLPVDAFQHPFQRAGRRNVIADALQLHLRPGEKGVIPFRHNLKTSAHCMCIPPVRYSSRSLQS